MHFDTWSKLGLDEGRERMNLQKSKKAKAI